MELPALLPNELEYASSAESDIGLFYLLIQTPQNFVLFFEYACEDETWSLDHKGFMQEATRWISRLFFEDRLTWELSARVVKKIREHHHVLDIFLEKDLHILLKDSGLEYQGSSLLWATSSEFMRIQIKQVLSKNSTLFEIDEMVPNVFNVINEYIKTGKTEDLWRKERDEVMKILHQASQWELFEIVEFCQEILIRYITNGNVIEHLLQAHDEKWEIVKKACFDFINRLQAGVRFKESDPESLALEFNDFAQEAMDIFESVRRFVTRLIFGYSLTEVSGFSEVINRCPNLTSLDINGSNAFSDRLFDIPDSLRELDISKCAWLNNKTLKKMTEICPNLISLHLAKNVQLPYSAWSILNNLKRLERLDISQCSQVKDEDFKIIIQACRDLTHFYLEGCSGLSDNAFFELGKHIPKLTNLSLSRTHITDSGLIDLMMRCRNLMALNVSRCPHLSEKGIAEAIENSTNLKTLQIAKNSLSTQTLDQIMKQHPSLQISQS